MKNGVIGGIIALVIGGTSFAVSKTDIIDNFSNETGLTHQEAKQYVESAQNDLASFSVIGSKLVDDGNLVLNTANSLDCINYTYPWESNNLSCSNGKFQMQTISNNEISLGNCYKALATDLGSEAKTKMGECIVDIDRLNSNYDMQIVSKLLEPTDLAESKKSNSYNKSVLQAALKAN